MPALLWLAFLLCGVATIGCSPSVPAADREPPPFGEKAPPTPYLALSYQGHWSHQYGQSPLTPSGEFVWAQPVPQGELESPGWQQSGPFRRFAGRMGNMLWVRTRLHGPPLRDGVLYLAGVDNIFEAYLDGKMVYHYGDMSGPPPYPFIGFRTHFIPIGSDYEGKTLVLRVYSDLRNIGPMGEPRLGERADLIAHLFVEDLPRTIVSALLIVLGCIMLSLYLLRREERPYFFYGAFTITIGTYILTQLQVRAWIFDSPLLWVHIELCALYLTLIFLCAFIELVIGRGPLGLTRWLRILHTAYFVGAALVIAARVVPLWQTVFPFQLLLVFDALYLTFAILYAAMRGNVEARIFAVGFVISAGITLYDVLAALRIIPRTALTMSHYGSVAFTLSLGTILSRRFVLLHRRLRDYSSVLQLSLAGVSVLDPDERTQVALDDLIRLLQARRALLFLTQPGRDELVFSAGRDDQKHSLTSAEDVDMTVVEQARTRQKPVGQRSAVIGMSSGRRVLGSLMAAPLLARGQLLGVIYLEGQTGRRVFHENDLDILLGLANQVAVALVAARAIKVELESALTRQRFEEQRSLLDAAVRMASGDLTSPIQVPEGSGFQHLAAALESMRRDLWAKLAMLETRNREIQSLNEELRRQIEQRSRRLMSTIMQRQGGKAPALASLDPGKILVGRYRVHRPIGRGAMGAVYEVERTSDGKRFAAKLLSTRADKASLLRFTREAQILSRLSHPNLIGIADIDMTAGGVLFIVLELVSGGNLLALRHRFGDVRWAMCVLRQISDALAAIHEAGIVHRDLKPGNVLIASERAADLPLIKLADFGVSLLTGEGSGPVALLSGRKPSSASLRGGIPASAKPASGRPPKMPAAARPPSQRSVAGEISTGPTPAVPPSAKEMHSVSVGLDDDDDADTGSIVLMEDSAITTSSLVKKSMASAGPPAARTAVSVNPSAVSMSGLVTPTAGMPVVMPAPSSASMEPRTLELGAVTPEAEARAAAIAASLDAADAKTGRPSQTSVSDLLAAAQEESVVVSGMLTQTDTLIGTPMYMAPELWNSGSHRAEPLSDIFSIGVIAFELLTGRMPFAVPPVMSRANDEPIYIARLAQMRPDLDLRLIALVESCLALSPESRPRARDLYRRLVDLGALSAEGA